jgi:hypothetical protein
MTIELKIKITEKINIKTYAFVFNHKAVRMNRSIDEGTFQTDVPVDDFLRWWMTGEPGGSMKVEVFRGDQLIATRAFSDIPGSAVEGTDRLTITIP